VPYRGSGGQHQQQTVTPLHIPQHLCLAGYCHDSDLQQLLLLYGWRILDSTAALGSKTGRQQLKQPSKYMAGTPKD